MQQAPASGDARAPVDLIAKQVRDHNPEQHGDNEQISEYRDKQAARFVTQKRRVEQRFGRKQTKNAERTYREKFPDKEKSQHIKDRKKNEKRFAKRGEFTHIDRGE